MRPNPNHTDGTIRTDSALESTGNTLLAEYYRREV
jgi:hypothetical protein